MRKDPLGNELPKCVYYKHGRYYLVKSNKWHPLGIEYLDAIAQAKLLTENILWEGETYNELCAHIMKLCAKAKNNATMPGRKQKEFALTPDYLLGLAVASGMRCDVTGTPFSLHKDEYSGKRPLAPSVDRIDNAAGYIPGNVRLVCVVTNMAMNAWGDSYLRIIAKNMTEMSRQFSRPRSEEAENDNEINSLENRTEIDAVSV